MVPADLCGSQAVLAAPPHAPEAVSHKPQVEGGFEEYVQKTDKLNAAERMIVMAQSKSRILQSNKLQIHRGVTTNPRHRQARLFTSRDLHRRLCISPIQTKDPFM